MSKGLISFIAYPESAEIEKIIAVFQGSGAETAYILHDKDVYTEDKPKENIFAGELKKEHWHILAGYETGYPTWKLFKEMCRACGAVAISPAKCFVKDIDKAYEYLWHKNNPEKFQYSAESIVHSEDWALDMYKDYVYNREQKSKKAKEVQKINVWELCDIITQESLNEFCSLTDFIRKQKPEFTEVFFSNQQFFKNYITSIRFMINNNTDLLQQIEDLKAENEKLKAAYEELHSENFRVSEELQNTKHLLQAVYELNGETSPQLYEF